MGVYASDVAEFARSTDDDAPLGDRLHGMAADLDLDSVEEVRDVRERL